MSANVVAKPARISAQIPQEDRSRMHRLFEEVQSRLQEMAAIGTRVVSEQNPAFAKAMKKDNQGTLLFEPVSRHAKDALDMKGVEIICYAAGCVVYDYDQNICYVA